MIHKQEGFVIVVALVVLMLLTMLGLLASRTAQIEVLIANNHKLVTQAFYNAESVVNVAKAVNLYSDDVPAPYYDNVNITDGPNPNEVIVTGTGYSPNKTHPGRATSIVEAGFVIDMDWETELNTALYVGNNLISNGAASVADGQSDPDCEAVWDVVSTPNAAEGEEATDWDGGTGPIEALGNDQASIPFDELFDHMAQFAVTVPASNNLMLGSIDEPRGVYMLTDIGGVKVNNLDGYGILLVDGPVEVAIGGSIGWNGIVLIRGDLTFNGGGTQEIFGSVLVSGDMTDNGGVEIYWDCSVMEMLKEKYTKYRMVWWRQP